MVNKTRESVNEICETIINSQLIAIDRLKHFLDICLKKGYIGDVRMDIKINKYWYVDVSIIEYIPNYSVYEYKIKFISNKKIVESTSLEIDTCFIFPFQEDHISNNENK